MSRHPFTDTVVRWFATHGRELPWRGIGDPYAIWLSEVILQQTRIAQGTDYWIRFYAERGMTVPEGAPGSNPGELSRRPQISIVAYRLMPRISD